MQGGLALRGSIAALPPSAAVAVTHHSIRSFMVSGPETPYQALPFHVIFAVPSLPAAVRQCSNTEVGVLPDTYPVARSSQPRSAQVGVPLARIAIGDGGGGLGDRLGAGDADGDGAVGVRLGR
ncbi:MAG: hypothetical protein ACRDT4_25475, partial [Micromonosporaceae bacterium]